MSVCHHNFGTIDVSGTRMLCMKRGHSCGVNASVVLVIVVAFLL